MHTPLKNVTCVKSQMYERTHYVAIAETHLQRPDDLFVSLYKEFKSRGNQPQIQFKIRLPRAETPVDDIEESKQQCHYHGKPEKKSEKAVNASEQSIVSQIAFS